jgi:hypothetical protein
MTRKLTDEQVQAINARRLLKLEFISINGVKVNVKVGQYGLSDKWDVDCRVNKVNENKQFTTKDEAIAYAEKLLNEKYCWLPQNNGWVMSSEVITYKTAGKVLELLTLANFNNYMFYEEQYGGKGDWYSTCGQTSGNDCMPCHFQFGEDYQFTIPADSPIWDAVAGVERWEVK